MDKTLNHKIRIGIGMILGLFFFYLAVRKIDFREMLQAFKTAGWCWKANRKG